MRRKIPCNRVHVEGFYLQKRNIIRRKWRGKLASRNSSSRKEETGKGRKTKAEERRRNRERQKSRKAESERESKDRERGKIRKRQDLCKARFFKGN